MPEHAPSDPAHPSGPVLPDIAQVMIVGPGLLGGSVGLGLKALGYAGRIVGVSRTRATLDEAVGVGAIDAGFTDVGEALKHGGRCLVVVCVPLGRFAAVFEALAPHQTANMVITDVGSTKLSVIAEAKRALPRPEFFVPAHPMAGSEKQGPKHAEARLFQGKPCVLCPDDTTDAGALCTVTSLWEALGSVVCTMTAEEHDQQVAAISHLPHLLSVLLTLTASDIGPLDLASSGFRDTTRLAASNPPMRADIIANNRAPIAQALDRFASRLEGLRALLRENKDDEFMALLNDAQAARLGWQRGVDGKAGSS